MLTYVEEGDLTCEHFLSIRLIFVLHIAMGSFTVVIFQMKPSSDEIRRELN